MRLVTLEQPLECFNDPVAAALIRQTAQLRLSGYREEQTADFLPLDATDYVANHLIVCDESRGSMRPIMTYKFIELKKALHHRLEFPALTIARTSRRPDHERAVYRIMEECEARRRTLAYAGSWTISPEVRRDRAFVRILKDLTVALHPLYMQEYGIDESILVGVIKHRSPEVLARMGYVPLKLEGKVLPSFPWHFLNDDEVQMLHLNSFSTEALELAGQFRFLWKSRLRIVPTSNANVADGFKAA
jgi:hypothetical protein